MPWRRGGALVAGAALLCGVSSAAVAAPPSVVFVLLDTTRADHFGAWGYAGDTTPNLDRLAGRGIRFAHHFANSHATRPSMPQLMTGRYYHDNILLPFQRDADPREMSFARPDPTAALLPGMLRAAGYRTVAVSAHTWVAPQSDFGRQFDRFEMVPFTTEEAHGDATPLVDRAIGLWRERDATHPLFLYLHFMDMHIPRPIPEDAAWRPVPGYDWRRRFRPNGEPEFGRERRSWSRYDASDFSPADRAYYTAVYDARLRHADAELGRLLAALEADDPGLGRTVVVVTADHGEELGEDDRIEHPPSLADSVQHVPLIVTGGGAPGGQRCDATTEHVDVVPTLLAALGVPLPPGVIVDGTSRVDSGGVLAAPCGGDQAVYAWEDYRAVRFHHWLLLSREPAQGPEALCDGAEQLFHVDGSHRPAIDRAKPARIARLRRRIALRLEGAATRFEAQHYDRPTVAFVVRADRWELDPKALRCTRIGPDTPIGALRAAGWMWTGRGIASLDPASELVAHVRVPSGTYGVEAATNPIAPPPWLFGRKRWRRRSFRHEEPSTYVPLGPTVRADDGMLVLRLPADTMARQHVLAVRLTPPGATRPSGGPVDREQEQRLRALGYVQ